MSYEIPFFPGALLLLKYELVAHPLKTADDLCHIVLLMEYMLK